MPTPSLTPWPAVLLAASGRPHPYLPAARSACVRGAAEVVTLELWVDAEPWQAMLASGQWRQIPILLSVLPVLDSALPRAAVTRARLDAEHVARLFEVRVAPESWTPVTRAAALDELISVVHRERRPAPDEVQGLAADFLASLAPWAQVLFLSSSTAWCDYFLGAERDVTLIALGPDGHVAAWCATDAP